MISLVARKTSRHHNILSRRKRISTYFYAVGNEELILIYKSETEYETLETTRRNETSVFFNQPLLLLPFLGDIVDVSL